MAAREQFLVVHAGDRKVGQQTITKGNRNHQQGFIALDDAQIQKHASQTDHDQRHGILQEE